MFGKWPSVGQAAISNDGRYVSYAINYPGTGTTLVLQRVPDGLKTSFAGAWNCHFAEDSRSACFQSRDSLFLLMLGQLQPYNRIATRSCEYPRLGDGKLLTYSPKGRPEELVLLNFTNGKETRFDSVKSYVWEDHGKALLIAVQHGKQTILQYVDPASRSIETIWSTNAPFNPADLSRGNVKFSDQGDRLGFLITENNGERAAPSLWFYRRGTDRAIKLADDSSQNVEKRLRINSIDGFSKNGNWLFLQLQKSPIAITTSIPGLAKVDIYHYKDPILQSQQLAKLSKQPNYSAVIPISGGSIIRLQNEIDGDSKIFIDLEQVTGNFTVLGEYLNKDFRPYWMTDQSSAYSYYLISLKDGSRTLLKASSRYFIGDFSFSPNGRWLVYWNSKPAAFVSCDLQTGEKRVLGDNHQQLKRTGDYINMFGNSTYAQPMGRIEWLNDEKFLTYDLNDLWKLDPSGKNTAINLTNFYGARHHISLRLVNENNIPASGKVLLTGFNLRSKQNGFFEISLDKSQDPHLLTMGAYDYYRNSSQLPTPRYSLSSELQPIKAHDADAWIISRQTAIDYPNYYYTTDFKRFVRLTDIQPQSKFNWITSELVNYKQLDGTWSQGILYKPENFDPRKKYPVIFNYYEHLSYRLYEFPQLEWTNNNINVPWFVSRGYLVFTPDSHYTIASSKNGKTVGEAVLNSVAGAARYLAALPYVDAKHMGIQGHSFGGGETNYLVTHSKLFAAACSVGGTVSDQVSAYLGPYRRNGYEPDFYRVAHSENGHEMIGATLWQRPDLYFRSSSIFTADKVVTPLLLMHNEADEQIDWGQSFELFTALSRLGKPVWLLQYDGEGHSLFKPENQKDFTLRLMQFFDHYLKGALAPKWMVEGVPAKLKGIDTGYELEPGKTP